MRSRAAAVVQATLMRMHDPPRLPARLLALRARRARRAARAVAPGDARRAGRAGDGRRGAERLRERLGDGSCAAGTSRRCSASTPRRGVGLWLDLVRAPPSGTWERRRADLYAAAEDVARAGRTTTRAEALEQLVRRYLAGFGPASRADVASYTGLAAAPRCARARRACAAPLPRARTARSCSTSRAPRCPTPTRPPRPASCRPGTRPCSSTPAAPASCPRSTAPRIFTMRNPHSVPTFLVDGAVAGTWRYGRRDRARPVRPLDAAARRELRDEADRLAAFHA